MPEVQTLKPAQFPSLLREIPDPPEQLYVRGSLPDDNVFFLAVVGSRKATNYGKDVCSELIAGLAGYPIVIVSGLALGMDSYAHKAALKHNLTTVALPGSGLNEDAIAPQTHVPLAKEILENGGALVSEFAPDFQATPWSFPKRNRIMAGMAHATLIIEAGERSGTLITARLALEYNRDVFTVPGSIFSDNTKGSHKLLRQGATPVTSSADIIEEFGLQKEGAPHENLNFTADEQCVFDALPEPLPRDTLIRTLNMETSKANQLLMAMEIKGLIKEEYGKVRKAK